MIALLAFLGMWALWAVALAFTGSLVLAAVSVAAHRPITRDQLSDIGLELFVAGACWALIILLG